MKAKELRKQPPAKLQKLLQDKREKLRKLYFDLPLDKVKDVSQVGATKKDIARILTILNEKQKTSSK